MFARISVKVCRKGNKGFRPAFSALGTGKTNWALSPSHIVNGPSRSLTTSQTSLNQEPRSESPASTHSGVSEEDLQMIQKFIRVDQAGETAAVWIYRGQMAILGRDPQLNSLLLDMKEQEKVHLNSFNKKIGRFNARPTVLQPISAIGGFALGVFTAMLGPKAAMACTEAVETSIGNHYNNQLRELVHLRGKLNSQPESAESSLADSESKAPQNPYLETRVNVSESDITQLMDDIKLFRDQELEHLDTAVENGAHSSVLYNTLSTSIQMGCKAAIYACERI
ncbi:5-demethoxyubiquinone hydroxylase, mitochondrial [Smittium mucronatum]|uniref:5-demethoxyubiquinone hydroxylase, mitochondrial n=1 Tax=Smittium mucronatum TaxID=133383 RepID=A0A1R0GRM4_9FUNG|nr:5-demethoxyubiquinone hydroxylase, mitochondrial [Smittium mucronatum]